MAIRVVSEGTTLVKSLTVGTPTKIGDPTAGNLKSLVDVNISALSDGRYMIYDSSTSKFIFTTIDSDVRSKISHLDLGGDGSLSYDAASGVISYTGPSEAEVRAHLSASNGINFDANAGNFTIDSLGISLSYDSSTGALAINDLNGDSSRVVVGINQLLQNGVNSIVPAADSTFDLGSDSNRWKELYLSGQSIHLGTIVLSDSNGELSVSSGGVTAPVNLSANTTDDLAEGSTNQYYLTTRVRSDLSLTTDGSGKFSYDSSTGQFAVVDSDLARTDIKDTLHEGVIIPRDKKITFGNGGGTGIVDVFEDAGNFYIRHNDVGDSGSSDVYIMTRHGSTIFFEDETGADKIATFRDHTGIDFYYNNVLNWQLTDSGVLNYRNETIHGTLTTRDSATINGGLNVNGNTVITGNLTVQGTETIINSTTLSVNDKNIVLADSAADSAAATGAGITVNGANATITYVAGTDTWDFNKPFGTLTNVLSNYTTTNLAEGTNLYYTQARFDSAFSDKTTTNLTEGTNLYYTQARFDTAFAGKSTSDLSEGSNLYYTTVRADSDFDVRLTTKTTSDVAEGTNLYYTTTRFDSDFDDNTTTDLTEGTNLYYTKPRVDSDIDAKVTKSYIDNLNVDADTFDLLNSTQFLRSDVVDTKTAGQLNFSNGVYAKFGDDSNLSIGKGAGLPFINAVSELSIVSDGLSIANTSGGGTKINIPTGTAGVQLYYNNSKKAETTDSGWDVSGNLDVSGSFRTITTDGLTEGSSNLYYTRVRFDSAIGDATSIAAIRSYFTSGDDITYDSTTGTFSVDVDQIYTQAQFDSDLNQSSTTNLPEGTNLYYTTARADSDARFAIAVNDGGGDGSLAYNNSTGTISYVGPSPTEVRAHFSAGDDIIYDSSTGKISLDVEFAYTAANFDSDLRDRLTTTTTDSIGEGNNLYYTTARADSDAKHAISVTDNGGDGSLSYSSTTGVISYTGPSAAEVRAHFSGGTSIGISSGTISVSQSVDSDADVKFNSVENTSGSITTQPNEKFIDSNGTTTISSFVHGGIPTSAEFIIHLFDSGNSESQISKMLATYDGNNVSSNEFGTVFTGSSDMGELDVGVDGTDMFVTFARTSGVGSVRAKVTKTIVK